MDTSVACTNGKYYPNQCPGPATVECCQGVQPFADRYWNCGDPACSYTVSAGTGQPNYQCAEFVARALSAGGWIPSIAPLASQSAYANYAYAGKVYDLLWVSDLQQAGSPLGLRELLVAMGWVTSSTIKLTSAVFVVGSDGNYGHVVVGVGSNLCDAHNVAHWHITPCNTYWTINEIRNAPAATPEEMVFAEDAGPLPEHLWKERWYPTRNSTGK